MRYLVVLLAAALAGCAYNIQLLPRGSAPKGAGTAETASKTIKVTLEGGDTYEGNYVQGRTYGIATTSGMVGNRPVFTSTPVSGGTNQYTALLVGPNGQIRCEFTATMGTGGNGVCVDNAERTYDMLITGQ